MQKPGKAKLPSQVHRPWSVPILSCIFHWFRREIFWALQIPFTRPVPWVYWVLGSACSTEARFGKAPMCAILKSWLLHQGWEAHCFPLCFISKLKHRAGGSLKSLTLYSDKVEQGETFFPSVHCPGNVFGSIS